MDSIVKKERKKKIYRYFEMSFSCFRPFGVWGVTLCPSKVMSVAHLFSESTNHEPKRARVERPLVMGFSDEDKVGTIQPHDDALVITLQIGGYNVKRVMVDHGSAAKIMYPDLYVLYRIRSTIIHGERWLMETPGKFCLLYSPCEG